MIARKDVQGALKLGQHSPVNLPPANEHLSQVYGSTSGCHGELPQGAAHAVLADQREYTLHRMLTWLCPNLNGGRPQLGERLAMGRALTWRPRRAFYRGECDGWGGVSGGLAGSQSLVALPAGRAPGPARSLDERSSLPSPPDLFRAARHQPGNAASGAYTDNTEPRVNVGAAFRKALSPIPSTRHDTE